MVSHKVAVSCAYFSAFFGLGLCLAVVGPSLLQLAANTGSGVDAIGSIFTWRAVGYLIGSVSGGQLFERLPGNPLLAIATLCCSIGTLFIPYCASLAALGLCTAVQGAAMGFLDTGGNVLLIRLWASEDDPSTADPYMQTMHFFFAVGAFVIPIIMDAYDQVGFAFAASFITISAYLLLVFLALVAVSWAEAAEKKAAHGGVGSVGTEKDAGKRKGPSARTVQESGSSSVPDCCCSSTSARNQRMVGLCTRTASRPLVGLAAMVRPSRLSTGVDWPSADWSQCP